ncbi:divalent-cation tolerance protein CutA [Erythrobacter sp. THAF29]|uniref:divalent-cation tolerance protein CutA n=1 Tax=Erythrobacter sp. THAF29 TaxID=2587851 RepID=UPI00126928E2|nr:divalent-cation tolerance protein CutA [Erythrobacter sp. THAF29]QFT76402.1 Divalent-cation tolerance protein CutA [Erythrobacter sp. THAF29]
MSKAKAALAWCPFPDRETAREIASVLFDEKLIACANIIGRMESLFEWDGERGAGDEIGVLFKTLSDQSDRLITRLGALHPYDTPAIVCWTCDDAHPATLSWLRGQLDNNGS